MSRYRQLVLLISLVAVGLVAAFPPWHLITSRFTIGCGYSFIAIAPQNGRCVIDLLRLVLQWAVVGCVGAIFYFLRK